MSDRKPGDDHAPKRADAIRSRERLLRATRKLLASGIAEAPIETIAKEAGVGVGTFYRHFENRQILLEAVYRQEIDDICQYGAELLDRAPAGKSLQLFLDFALEHAARNMGFAQALATAMELKPNTTEYGQNKLLKTIETIMTAAVTEGSIRDDIGPETIVAAMNSLCRTGPSHEWLAQGKAIMNLIMDGLRVQNFEVEN